MLVTYYLRGSGRGLGQVRLGVTCAAVLALLLGCQNGPIGPGVLTEELALEGSALGPGVVLDMGAEDSSRHVVGGFSSPEPAGSRRASWSEAEVSTVAFQLQGGAKRYQVTFLAEPYHELGDVTVGVALNNRRTGEAQISRGWRSYRVVVPGDMLQRGRNELSFHFSKTGRPSEFDPRLNDVRELGARFEQIEVQPVTSRLDLAFGSRNALALAALGEGWDRDPGDRGTGTWTLGQRSVIRFAIDRVEGAYRLELEARAPRGISARSVRLSLNGASLGELAFADSKSTHSLELPADRLRAENELVLEFGQLDPPADVDPKSNDTRLLGLRVFHLEVTPGERAQLVASPKH
jgi:hypothetical protein